MLRLNNNSGSNCYYGSFIGENVTHFAFEHLGDLLRFVKYPVSLTRDQELQTIDRLNLQPSTEILYVGDKKPAITAGKSHSLLCINTKSTWPEAEQ